MYVAVLTPGLESMGGRCSFASARFAAQFGVWKGLIEFGRLAQQNRKTKRGR
jgi:hypothetical protein